MGSALSRTAKKAPKLPSNAPMGEILPFARPPPPTSADRLPSSPPQASSSKSAEIEDDAKDPTLGQFLHQLGQVSVPPSPTLFRADNRMLNILAQRKSSEEAVAISSLNRPSAQALANLLDERKSCKTRAEVEKLAEEYGIEIALVDELGKFLNAPSVSGVRTKKEDLQETQMAKWVDPPRETQR